MKKDHKEAIAQIEYTCLNCQAKFKADYLGWQPNTKCSRCGKTAQYSQLASQGKAPFFQKYADLTAQMVDKATGEPFWVDKKGRKVAFDDSSVRYDLLNDRFGWRKTGKKVRATDKYGRPL